ncbi:MAG: glutathione S-transferase family protein [Proteobacteria bacterium]|nr:glutathione S-transferase family protein [Pseudomonadota bacterium]MDA1058808.1 glutathione S-transferase family protein [Pseudomonadota bacterium]
MSLTLVVGSKNYSSWSMRAGVALSHCGVPYDEIVIPLDGPDTPQRIADYSRAGRVPVLIDGENPIWDSLAIIEYLAEKFPESQLWPSDPMARAIARSVSAEMHAGFTNLRTELPMNCRRCYEGFRISDLVARDIDRICEIWRETRSRFGQRQNGEFLFGPFGGADAMFAPVASRFVTYGVSTDATVTAYVDALLKSPAVQTWMDAAHTEPTIERYEFEI